MDSRKNNQSNDRRREEALARRMGEALDRLSPRKAGECPDAGIIAAYHERALGPEESELWENHFAGCSRCRKILAVLAASVEEPLAESEIARLGELVAASAQPAQAAASQKVKPIRPRRWDWRARWLAPALGVAAALAMWFAVRPPWRTANGGAAQTLIAQAPKNEVAPSAQPEELDRLSKQASPQDQKVQATTPRDFSAAGPSSPGSSNQPPAERRAAAGNGIGDARSNAGIAASALQNDKKEGGVSGEERKTLPPSVPAAPPSAQAAIASGETTMADKLAGATGNAAPRDEQALAPSPSDSAMSSKQAAPQLSASAQKIQRFGVMKAEKGTPTVLLKAPPSGTNLWRAGKDGSIERSTDAGRSWTAQASPSREDWLAGAAVSDTAGWLVGRNGAIGRTMDGQRWDKIAPPPSAADTSGKFPDWTAVTAQGAQVATITARDGRRFATQDGGKTWQPQ